MTLNEERRLTKRLNQAKIANNSVELAKCSRRLADFYTNHRRYQEALDLYLKELKIHEENFDEKESAQSHRMIAECYTYLGQLKESLIHIQHYLDYAIKKNDIIEKQRAYVTKGRSYLCLADELHNSDGDKNEIEKYLNQCKKAFKKSLAICENELDEIDKREKSEMMCRSLFNLARTSEIEENLEAAQKYLSSAIQIARKDNCYEDLNRCLNMQGNLFVKQTNLNAALASFDSAADNAMHLENPEEWIIVAALHKSEVLLAQGDFIAAKKILKRAYKMKTTVEEDKDAVESNLRKAILIGQLESQLAVLPENKLFSRKLIYEKLGDAWCSVKNYPKAIDFYRKMLSASEKLGAPDKDLLACYVSLWETYKDTKEYDLALDYAYKDLEISKKTNVTEEGKTLLNIGDILELKKEDFQQVEEKYLRALNCGKQSKNRKLQYQALKRLSKLLSDHGKVEKLESILRDLKQFKDVDLDSDNTQEVDPAEDIDLEVMITDSEEENLVTVKRPTRTGFKIIRNQKGETQLHIAAIRGDCLRAKKLLEQGHPIHEHDYQGWTPLHEACNHGHLPMVEVLIEHGANVNNSGGKGCGGITPLHDAASCGHFSVMDYLLDKGASIVALTDNGETPLDFFLQWRKRAGALSPGDETYYNLLVKRLENPLNAAEVRQVATKRKVSPVRTNRERYRKCVSPSGSSSGEESVGCEDYRKTIKALRKPTSSFDHSSSNKRSTEPLISEEEFVEDWLEDDLGVYNNKSSNKTKSVCAIREWTEQSNVRNRSSPPPPKRCPSFSESKENVTEIIALSPSPQDFTPVSKKAKPNTPTNSEISKDLLKVRLKVNDRLLLISLEPVKDNLDTLTVQWLLDEAIERYKKLVGEEPCLLLETQDGAVISENDPLKVILNESLNGKIVGYKSYSLLERYKMFVLAEKIPGLEEPDPDVCSAFEKAVLELSVENVGLLLCDFVPVFKTIRFASALTIINLSGNCLRDEGLQMIPIYMDHLELKELHLRANNLTLSGVKDFMKNVAASKERFRNSLARLDLSYNPLGSVLDEILEKMPLVFSNLCALELKSCELPYL